MHTHTHTHTPNTHTQTHRHTHAHIHTHSHTHIHAGHDGILHVAYLSLLIPILTAHSPQIWVGAVLQEQHVQGRQYGADGGEGVEVVRQCERLPDRGDRSGSDNNGDNNNTGDNGDGNNNKQKIESRKHYELRQSSKFKPKKK